MVSIGIIEYIITVFTAVMASGGLWTLLQRRLDRRDDKTKLLLGMCHDRIFFLGLQYLERGFVTKDELVNIHKYLSEPYFKLGGNGAVEGIMERIDKLPVRDIGEVLKEMRK